jgi:hypothetical protein
VRTSAPALALALAASFQPPMPTPPPLMGGPQELPPVPIEQAYAPLLVEDLETVADGGRSYHRRLVQVRGVVGDPVPGRYVMLRRGTARVMLIPMDPSDSDRHVRMLGMDVDVTGVARVLPASQKMVPCRGTQVPESKCEDWDLPALPDAEAHWPPVSISVTRMVERGTGQEARRPAGRSESDTTIAGQFRGANLCGDLPAPSRRSPEDWVLLTPQGPVWVTGRRPEGRGFRLDPTYRGDTSRWLEVGGKVQVAEGVRYLKAGKVALIARPQDAAPVPCPP